MKDLFDSMTSTAMRLWQDFLDSLNTDGGHILLLIVVVAGGMAGLKYGIPKSEDIFLPAFTALLILLKAAGSNKTRRDRPTPIVETSTATVATTSTTDSPKEQQ